MRGSLRDLAAVVVVANTAAARTPPRAPRFSWIARIVGLDRAEAAGAVIYYRTATARPA